MQHNTSEPINRTFDPLISRKAFAAELGVNTSTLWRWAKNGHIPQPVRIGGRVGWPQSTLTAWKSKQGWEVAA